MKYKVRFHLQRGLHYMHWQIRSCDGSTKYIDPKKYQIEMFDCKLINKINAARKVNLAGKKDVCGWVECENFSIHDNDSISVKYFDKVQYNPIKDVHWRRSGDDGLFDWDNSQYESLITNGNQVLIMEESLCLQ